MEKYAGVEPNEEVAKRFVAETGLKMEFARKLLNQYASDFEFPGDERGGKPSSTYIQ